MKLNTAQWLWVTAAALLMASVLLDLADILNIPPIYWLLGGTTLLVIDWWLMNPLKEIKEAQRRRS